jgi:hypothetical protein
MIGPSGFKQSPLAVKTLYGVHVPSVIGIGRVGSFANAKRSGKSRPHKYWAISKWRDNGVVFGPVPDEAHPKFKSKKAATEYLDALHAKVKASCE